MENINNLLFTEASSVVTTNQMQNVTFLQNAFMVTFFTFLGLEGLKYFIGWLQFALKMQTEYLKLC